MELTDADCEAIKNCPGTWNERIRAAHNIGRNQAFEQMKQALEKMKEKKHEKTFN